MFFATHKLQLYFLPNTYLRGRLFTWLRQRFKQNAAPACLVKKKNMIHCSWPRLLLHLQRRVDRNSLGLLLLQLCNNTINNGTPCRNRGRKFTSSSPSPSSSSSSCAPCLHYSHWRVVDQLFPFPFSFFLCTMSPLFTLQNSRPTLPLPLLFMHHVSTILQRE